MDTINFNGPGALVLGLTAVPRRCAGTADAPLHYQRQQLVEVFAIMQKVSRQFQQAPAHRGEQPREIFAPIDAATSQLTGKADSAHSQGTRRKLNHVLHGEFLIEISCLLPIRPFPR
ncbi:MAG: hypothetical protein FWG56_05785 [Desulfovibrionaceae bacterium]|nr:hypothetical protein [Desulfovibrionaceae bacterium]